MLSRDDLVEFLYHQVFYLPKRQNSLFYKLLSLRSGALSVINLLEFRNPGNRVHLTEKYEKINRRVYERKWEVNSIHTQ